MANEEPSWKQELNKQLTSLERRFRTYERIPCQEAYEEYDKSLGDIWHTYAQKLDIYSEAEREQLIRNHQEIMQREPREPVISNEELQRDLARLAGLQRDRNKDLERLCTEPLIAYEKEVIRFARDRDQCEH